MKTLPTLVSAGLVLACGCLATTALAVWDQECVDNADCDTYEMEFLVCFPDGSCGIEKDVAVLGSGGVIVGDADDDECLGDNDGDGIDDLCDCTELSPACCLPDGCQDGLDATTCRAMGGFPRGACTPCVELDCPFLPCVGSIESCFEPHGSAGCEYTCYCQSTCNGLPHCCEGPYCGDGVADPGEECDDGNYLDGDGCSVDCKIEQDVPATTYRGMVFAALLLLVASTAYLLRRRAAQ